MRPGGCPSKEPKTSGWEFRETEVTNVLRIVVLGGSICRILLGLEAPGAPASNHAVRLGGCLSKKPKTSGREFRETRSDECLENCGSGRLHLSSSTRFGGPGRSQPLTTLWYRVGALLKNLRFRGLRRFDVWSSEVGSSDVWTFRCWYVWRFGGPRSTLDQRWVGGFHRLAHSLTFHSLADSRADPLRR